jgi:Putative beta-barrel porin-2, OmpL-like. bbp2
MKVNWLVAAIATIVTGLGLTLTAAAEGPAYHAGSSDYYVSEKSVSTVANHQPSASDQPGVAPVPAPAVCVAEEEAPEEEECEQWHLFCQKECGANVYGFLDAGIMFNVDDPVDAYNGPVTFPDRDFGQFNQGYVIVEDVADNEGCGTDWGYRLDFLGGSDYVFTMAAGLELHQNFAPHWNQRAPGESSEYGIALPQFFVDVAYNDWKIKLGHFYTPIGYEVVPANGNFFYTHAYTMQYGEPFTHTGVLGAYKYSDTTTLNIGVVNGWDAFDKVNDEAAPIFGFAWDGGEGLTVAWNAIFSNEEPVPLGPAAGTLTNRALYSLVVGYTFGCDDEWQYVFQHDCGWQTGASAFTPGANAEWYGVNQYLFYTVNDCWKAGARFEWFRDDDGSRVTGLRNPGNAIFGQSFAGNFYECSLGMNWTPTANWIVRPELRYDWFDGVGTVAGPYNAGTQDSQFLLGFDAIFLW